MKTVTHPPPSGSQPSGPQPGQPWQVPDPTAPTVPAGSEVAPGRRRRGVSPKLILAIVIAVAAIWFVVVNNQRAKINLWVHTYNVPVWLVLLCTFVAGMLVDRLLRVRKKRKQQPPPV